MDMKIHTFLFSLGLSTLCPAENGRESEFPLISGHYEVVGRRCDSEKLFSGTITIDETKPNVFTVTRIIDGKTSLGSGQVESVTPDKIPVLRIRFVENGENMEGTFQWRADLDNDGRLSGYVFPKGYQGKKPGLEALFAKKG